MPWERNYYYRSKRVRGQPRRIYIGTGLAGLVAAEEDRRAREERELERSMADQLRAAHAQLDAEVAEVHRLADVLSRAALHAAGYHQHCMGDWRPKRDFHRV